MKCIIGIDEVGRGPLAGPVTLCACMIPKSLKAENIFENGKIKDSKKLKKENRKKVYQTIMKLRKLEKVNFSVSSRNAEYIDKHGISKAIKSCIKSILTNLVLVDQEENIEIVLDGSLHAPEKYKNQKTIIKGDEKELSIALASIIAKCRRDTHMEKLAKQEKNYDWENNMGYGTAKHLKGVKKYGLTKYHRKTYIKQSFLK